MQEETFSSEVVRTQPNSGTNDYRELFCMFTVTYRAALHAQNRVFKASGRHKAGHTAEGRSNRVSWRPYMIIEDKDVVGGKVCLALGHRTDRRVGQDSPS